mgnify:CR=1 FL=1
MKSFREFCNEGFTDKIVRTVHLLTHQKIRNAGKELEQTLETETDINRKVDKLGKNLSRMIRNLSGLSLAGLNRGDGPLNNIGKIKSLIS